MRKISTLFIVLLFSINAFSQSYSLSIDTSFTSQDFVEIVPGAPIENPTTISLTINFPGSFSKTTKWFRTNLSLPSGWQTSVCDLMACYDISSSDSNEFTIDTTLTGGANTITGPIYVDFYPTSIGYAITNLHLFDKNNPADSVNATFVGIALGSSSTGKVIRVKDIYLAPVPARDNLNIICDASVQPIRAEVYDILGKMKTSVTMAGNGSSLTAQVNVSGLAKGLYFLRVYTADNKILTRQFSKD